MAGTVGAPAAGATVAAAAGGGVATMTLLGPPPLLGGGVWAVGPHALATRAKPARIEDSDAFMGVRLLASAGDAYPGRSFKMRARSGREPNPRSARQRAWLAPDARGDRRRHCAAWRWGCDRRAR